MSSKNRKVIKTGNSLAVTIPAKAAFDLDIKEGDIAQITVNRSKGIMTCKFSGHPRQLSLINSKKAN